VFGGNNFVFCMKGNRKDRIRYRCFGGDRPDRLIMSSLMINIPGVVFNIFVIKPLVNDMGYSPLLYVSIVLQILSTVLMFFTGLSDPGIIPKNYFDKET
jgi:Na+/melibiose symporter-like transporter